MSKTLTQEQIDGIIANVRNGLAGNTRVTVKGDRCNELMSMGVGRAIVRLNMMKQGIAAEFERGGRSVTFYDVSSPAAAAAASMPLPLPVETEIEQIADGIVCRGEVGEFISTLIKKGANHADILLAVADSTEQRTFSSK